MPPALLVLAALTGAALAELYHTYWGTPLSAAEQRRFDAAGLLPWCTVDVPPCDANAPRRLDGSCNNLAAPSRGAALTPYVRLLPAAPGPAPRVARSGRALPGARRLRTALVSDGVAADTRHTQLLTHWLVALTGEVTSLHDTVNYVLLTTTCCAAGAEAGARDPRCQPVPVPDDDPVHRYSDVRCLNLTRAITYQRLGCLSDELPPERINTSPPMLELSMVYGNDARAATRGRTGQGGLLREDPAAPRFPPGGSPACLNNRRPEETRCHDTPNPGTNSIIGLNLVTLWWYRTHNALARRLRDLNPCWDDERLFTTARDINIALVQHITYHELAPLLIGHSRALELGLVRAASAPRPASDYDPRLTPGVSIEYVITTRWFHTMQDGFLNLYDADGALLGRRAVVDDTLRSGILDRNRTLEGLTQGAFRQPAAAADHLVDPEMGERVLGPLQRVSDVISSDIMKGRDVMLPSYNEYRRRCGTRVARRWEDLLDAIDRDKVDALRLTYEHVDDVELMAGVLAERTGAWGEGLAGPTLRCVLEEQLVRWQRADRFWYEWTLDDARLRQVRRASAARLLCDAADDVRALQPRAFELAGEHNAPRACRLLPAPDLEPWRDPECRHRDISHD